MWSLCSLIPNPQSLIPLRSCPNATSSTPSPSPGRRTTRRATGGQRGPCRAGPAQEFDYLVPDGSGSSRAGPPGEGAAGARESAGARLLRAAGKPAGRARPLKPLDEVVDRRSLLSPAMLRLTRWIADHYLCDWGQVLETVLPAGVRLRRARGDDAAPGGRRRPGANRRRRSCRRSSWRCCGLLAAGPSR